MRAEAIFLEKVIALHPQADGKPCVIGNCQAGWAIMMLAAMRPELFGPIIVAGAPLSYWAGVHGKNPMRYSGGLLGGSWLTALTGDLGNGKFDGAWLVQNFESQNPANTLWSKQYNLYSSIDTEASRYLGFERWWGGHFNMNAEEIQTIVDDLFIGNKLAAGEIQTSDGTAIDLRNIRSPIVVFCSKGDNITPPQQALGWILDLYENVEEIRAYGQTIVYTIHETVGHLGIFVSAGVARKEHDEFSSNIDFIDVLPPGLYEAVFEEKTENTISSDLVSGNWTMRCEARTLDDIRALGGNDAADERCFATAARVSEINLSLYRTFGQPLVQAMTSAPMAEKMRGLHSLRLQYEMFSEANPLMAPVKKMADQVRNDRKPVNADNPFLALQETISNQVVANLDAWREMTRVLGRAFVSIDLRFPLVTGGRRNRPGRHAAAAKSGKDRAASHAAGNPKIEEIESRITTGSLNECLARSLLYVGMVRGSADERGFAAIRQLRALEDDKSRLTLAEFKALIREQYYMLLIDQEATLSAIPGLLPSDADERRRAFASLRQVLSTAGELSSVAADRLQQVGRLFDLEARPIAVETSSTGSEGVTVARAS